MHLNQILCSSSCTEWWTYLEKYLKTENEHKAEEAIVTRCPFVARFYSEDERLRQSQVEQQRFILLTASRTISQVKLQA